MGNDAAETHPEIEARIVGLYNVVYDDGITRADIDFYEVEDAHTEGEVYLPEFGLNVDLWREWSTEKRVEVLLHEFAHTENYEDDHHPDFWDRVVERTEIAIAREVEKPIVVHTRDAADDTLSILREEKARDVGGIIHCFSEDAAFAGDVARGGPGDDDAVLLEAQAAPEGAGLVEHVRPDEDVARERHRLGLVEDRVHASHCGTADFNLSLPLAQWPGGRWWALEGV
jgi:hypothetical protein